MDALTPWRSGCFAALMLMIGFAAAQERKPLSEAQARELLASALQAERLYGADLPPDCIEYYTERYGQRHFDFTVTGKEEERCAQFRKPDAKVDEFRVFRDGSKVLWFSDRDGGFVELTLAKEHRKP